jgi:hypothetical protein
VIHPIDPEYKPAADVILRLKGMGKTGLAAFAGFPGPHFSPTARVVDERDMHYGEGMEEPVISCFAVVVENALRERGPLPGFDEPVYESTVPRETMEELERLLGAKLGQVTYVR